MIVIPVGFRMRTMQCLSIALLVTAAGCREDTPSFEVVSLEGKIESVEARSDGTGEIRVLYFSEKHGEELVGIGTITPETEILINGAVAKAVDLREGDRVRGQVRVEKTREGKKRTALKIFVDRAVLTGE